MDHPPSRHAGQRQQGDDRRRGPESHLRLNDVANVARIDGQSEGGRPTDARLFRQERPAEPYQGEDGGDAEEALEKLNDLADRAAGGLKHIPGRTGSCGHRHDGGMGPIGHVPGHGPDPQPEGQTAQHRQTDDPSRTQHSGRILREAIGPGQEGKCGK